MQKIKITKNDHNKRIDKFLISYYNLPKSHVMKKFRLKDIRINGKKTNDQSYLLKEGDEIITYFRGTEIKKIEIAKYDSKINIIYQDDNILLVNKPVGILVSADKPNDLHSKVLSYLDSKGKIPHNTSYQPINIHRLDKYTSGIVIFSLNYQSHCILSKAIGQENMIEKYYFARVKGIFPKKLFLKDKIEHNEIKQKMVINAKFGKVAKLEVKKIRDDKKSSLVDIKLITGRKHQIRVQLSNAGYPLIGDPKYDGPKASAINLCAYKVVFKELIDDLKYLNGKSFEIKKPIWK